MMDIVCKECRKDLTDPVEDTWEKWLFLSNFVEVQYLQGELTDGMYERLLDCLQDFKPIDDEKDDDENS